MTPEKLVYKEVLERCVKAGCTSQVAKEAARITLEKCLRNQFTKPSKLIDEAVVDAKKLTKKKGKK